MAENKRTKEVRENDLVKISKLYLQGKTQREIAQVIGVSRVQISYDLKQIFTEWKAERISTFEERLLLELSKIDFLESEAWEAWEKSKVDTGRISEIKNEQGKIFSHTYTVEGVIPNKLYLDIIFKCIETRLKILAVLPKKEVPKNDIPPDGEKEIIAVIDLPSNGR